MNTTAFAVFRRRALFLLALFAGALAGGAHAQQYLYRGMRLDPAIPAPVPPRPSTAVNATGLTVRPNDVGNPGALALVQPTNGQGAAQGMSVVWSANDADACQLPPHARPAGNNWNGTPGNPAALRVWRLDLIAHPLPVTLASSAASLPAAPPLLAAPMHALVTSVVPGVTLAALQAAVVGTAAHWTIVPPPAAPCP